MLVDFENKPTRFPGDKEINRHVLRSIATHMPGSVVFDSGRRRVSESAAGVQRDVLQLCQEIVQRSQDLRLPDSKPMRREFVDVLVRSRVDDLPIRILNQVCPDYGLSGGISKEAEAGVRASQALQDIFGDDVSQTVLVADTESDIPEVVERHGGNPELYLAACRESVEAISLTLPGVEVTTFTEYFGDRFHECQYNFEALIRTEMDTTPGIGYYIRRTSLERRAKHAAIIGREEKDYELSVRYMAQYAAFGSLVRQEEAGGIVLVNYSTPNRAFYNFADETGLALHDSDQGVLPVIGSIVRQ